MRRSGVGSRVQLVVGLVAATGVIAATAPAAQAATEGSCTKTAALAVPTTSLACTFVVECPTVSPCTWQHTGRGSAQVALVGLTTTLNFLGGPVTNDPEAGQRLCQVPTDPLNPLPGVFNAFCDAGPRKVTSLATGPITLGCSVLGGFQIGPSATMGLLINPAIRCEAKLV